MEARSHSIVEELKMLQSSLAEMPVAMPFAVPNGYFLQFPEAVAQCVFFEENTQIPDVSPAFGILKTPFVVPEGYFQQFSDALREILAIGTFEARLSRQNVFSVPGNYFDNLPETILDVVREKADLPQGLSAEMPFEVPKGYFDQFAADLQARLKDDVGPKMIPLSSRPAISIQLMRWAAAAILILGVTLGIQQAGTPQSLSQTTKRALSSIPEKALDDYVYQHADEFDLDMIESQLPQGTFHKTSPVQNLKTHEIQVFLSEEILL